MKITKLVAQEKFPSFPDFHPQLKTTSARGKSRSPKEKRMRRYKHRQKMVSIQNA
jgi:hypothetical protein